jgi:endoglucanase
MLTVIAAAAATAAALNAGGGSGRVGASRDSVGAKRLALYPLSVKHNQIIRRGVPFRFHGVNRDSLEWGRANWGGCGGDGHFTDRDFDRITRWRVTAVRIPLSQAAWLGRSCDARSYARAVDAVVAKANERGMYVILDLHWTDVGGRAPCGRRCTSGQQPMPDADSVTFWRRVARRYASAPGVVFGLYNEPHGVSWKCWRDGGCITTSDPLSRHAVRYLAVGMQRLYAAIRAQRAHNLVLVGGLDYAYDLTGVGKGYALRGRNIAYDSHVFTNFHTTTAEWDAAFGYLTDRYPVVATEFGSFDCSAAVTRQLLRYFDRPLGKRSNRMSWTIWSWNNPGNCSQPSIIANWSGVALPGQGQLVKRTLARAAR